MTEPGVVMSVRVPPDVKRRLDDRAHQQGFANTTEYHRALLTNQAELDDEEAAPISPPKTQEPDPSGGSTCPLTDLLRKEPCASCPSRRVEEKP